MYIIFEALLKLWLFTPDVAHYTSLAVAILAVITTASEKIARPWRVFGSFAGGLVDGIAVEFIFIHSSLFGEVKFDFLHVVVFGSGDEVPALLVIVFCYAARKDVDFHALDPTLTATTIIFSDEVALARVGSFRGAEGLIVGDDVLDALDFVVDFLLNGLQGIGVFAFLLDLAHSRHSVKELSRIHGIMLM